MGSRDLVKELTQMNLDPSNPQSITQGTLLHDQKMSNLCVYFATLSSLRHEIKNLFKNLNSAAVNSNKILFGEVFIPAGKSIDELLEEKESNDDPIYRLASLEITNPNALSFERMLAVLLGCVSPRALSGKDQIVQSFLFIRILISIDEKSHRKSIVYIDHIIALDGVNIDTRGIREQISVAKKIALRLVSATIFEVEGWRRIQAIPLAFEAFGFDPQSATVEFEEVELPISIGNKHFIGGQTFNKTFLVS